MSKKDKPKLIVVIGPTSSGKSDVAVELAKKFNGEVISADSRQVYKYMNIGSGKITKKEMLGIKHYLLDVANPSSPKTFSVSDFQKLGKEAIDKILNKNKIPIIAGGTGFYIDSLVYETNIPKVKENKSLRKKLDKKSCEELFKNLKKLDKDRAKEIDPKNKVRLIRAIEIVKELGKVPKANKKSNYDVLWIGLDWPKEKLNQRIKDRLLIRIKAGMIAEAKRLHSKYKVSYKKLESFGLDYRYLALHLKNKISKEEMIEEINTKNIQYAKRQQTWFKRNKKISWFEPKKSELSKIFKLTKEFLK